jgi:hypothetical protein
MAATNEPRIVIMPFSSRAAFKSLRVICVCLFNWGNTNPQKLSQLNSTLHCKTNKAKPHIVRKWLLGLSKPSGVMLVQLAYWLNIKPKDLLKPPQEAVNLKKASIEIDFTDYEVISKYLSMSVKQKVTVKLLIDTIAKK